MNDSISTNKLDQQLSSNSELNLSTMLTAVLRGKLWIMLFTVIVTAIVVVYVISLSNVYKSEVLLVPKGDDSGLKLPSQLGSLAALAGVDVGAGDEKTTLAIEMLKSRQFLIEFIKQNELAVPLIAATGWNNESNQLIIDEEIYDINSKQWVREAKYPKSVIPSDLELYEEFLELFSISQDKINRMVKLSIEFYSPVLAKEWLNVLVLKINQDTRKIDLDEATKSLTYLSAQLELTQNASLTEMLYSLIEEQTKTIMLTKVRDDYTFSIVDPPFLAEKPVKPKRAISVVVTFIFAFFIACLACVVLFYKKIEEGRV